MRLATQSVDQDLRRVLDDEVRRRTGRRVRAVQRRPHPYRTSFPLEELDVDLDDGGRLELVWKDLGVDRLEGPARVAKESVPHDPRREIEAYGLLEEAGLGTPGLYGAVSDPARGRAWLLIERIPGVPLWQIGEREVWEAAAAWLATMHRRFHGTNPGPGSPLIVYDGAHARAAMRRATARSSARLRSRMERLVAGFREVASWLESVPTTLVHGDFHASNILVDATQSPPRIAPADWERAGIGPGLLDLASLTAGGWTQADRAALEAAYARSAGRPFDEEFLADVERCRLLNAVGLLGLPSAWRPPPEHDHDWLREAESAAERLGDF
jgi:aminoglycoside phosphotransferase